MKRSTIVFSIPNQFDTGIYTCVVSIRRERTSSIVRTHRRVVES